jgi:hypothetical protein
MLRPDTNASHFADGHTEVWPIVDPCTRNWSGLPIPNQPPNPDWARLQASTSSVKQP